MKDTKCGIGKFGFDKRNESFVVILSLKTMIGRIFFSRTLPPPPSKKSFFSVVAYMVVINISPSGFPLHGGIRSHLIVFSISTSNN